jgi:glycosyltransferase involved in cell wall biosynthesis
MVTPAVSVVVPCYNGGCFLDQLLGSLAAQTFRDFEIVIVDDGSTDPVTQNKLASLDPAVRIIRQANRGLAGARNTGFRAARATFVVPLDCDDKLEPTFLEETFAALHEARSDIGFAFTHVRLGGTRAGVRACHFDRFDQLFVNELPYCLLIRKSAWETAGGYDEAMHDGYEDWEFSIRLLAAGYRGIEIAKPLFVYAVSGAGMLLSRSARIHGTLWSRIRSKHPALFRPSTLWNLSRSRKGRSRRISAAAAAVLLALSHAMPESWFNWLYFRVLVARRRVSAAPE